MTRFTCSILLSLFIVAVSDIEAASPQTMAPIVVPVGQRQLFLDDNVVASTTGLTRTMHQPEKKGAVVQPDQPWEKWIETRCAPVWNPERNVFQLWTFTCTPTNAAGATYAESSDGLHWNKPALRQWKYQGSLENNFITPDPQLQWPHSIMENVVYDPHDADPNRRYKGFLGAEYRQPIISPDGIHWSILDVPRIPSMDESNLSYDALTRTFIATTKVWTSMGRSHAIWTSKDFNAWTQLDKLFAADDQDQQLAKRYIAARQADPTLQQVEYEPGVARADIYNVAIFRYEGLYVAMPAFYYATAGKEPHTHGFHLIQLACSRDLQTWRRLGDRKPFIGPSPVGQGAYDLTQILPPSAPVVRDDELWFYYSCQKYREVPKDADPKEGAVCLAVLRRDGFVSMDATDKQGTLLTKPFKVNGAKLFVNAEAAKGVVKVEVLDKQGKVVDVSCEVVGDHPRAAVAWSSGGLANLNGQTISLRFTMRQARLYSFWLEE